MVLAENVGFNDTSVAVVNDQLSARRRRVEELRESGQLWSLSPAERQVVTRKIRRVAWLPVASVLDMYSSPTGQPKRFVDDWQRAELDRWSAFGVSRQPAVKGFVEVLTELVGLGSREAIEAAVSRIDRPQRGLRTDSPPSVPPIPRPAHDRLPSLGVVPSALPLEAIISRPLDPGSDSERDPPPLRVLSYNLNVLPVGVAMLGTGQGLQASERLDDFIRVIEHGSSSRRRLERVPTESGSIAASPRVTPGGTLDLPEADPRAHGASSSISRMIEEQDMGEGSNPWRRPVALSLAESALMSTPSTTPERLGDVRQAEPFRFEESLPRRRITELPLGRQPLLPEPRRHTSVRRHHRTTSSHSSQPGTKSYDILLLQEVFASPFAPCFCRQKHLIRKLTKAGYKWVAKTPSPTFNEMLSMKKGTDGGLLILSKFPILESDYCTFSAEGLSLDRGASKGVLFARVAVSPGPDKCVDVFNCHLQATHAAPNGPSSLDSTDPEVRSSFSQARRVARAMAGRTVSEGEDDDEQIQSGCWCAPCCSRCPRSLQLAVYHWLTVVLTYVWAVVATTLFWWICLVPGLSRNRPHTPSSGDGDSYEAVRRRQLQELVRFIQRKTHGHGYPWILTGDFNVDAIAQDAGEGSGLAYFSGAPSTGESEAYQRLMQSLAPLGEASGGLVVKDLLKMAAGRHLSTRPPRMQFPKGIDYLLRHKYPQRLDYTFSGGGGAPGQLIPDVEATCVVEFRVDEFSFLPRKAGAKSTSDESRSRIRPYDYLSDHFGIEVVFQSSSMQWKELESHDSSVSWSLLPEHSLSGGSRSRSTPETSERLLRTRSSGASRGLSIDQVMTKTLLEREPSVRPASEQSRRPTLSIHDPEVATMATDEGQVEDSTMIGKCHCCGRVWTRPESCSSEAWAQRIGYCCSRRLISASSNWLQSFLAWIVPVLTILSMVTLTLELYRAWEAPKPASWLRFAAAVHANRTSANSLRTVMANQCAAPSDQFPFSNLRARFAAWLLADMPVLLTWDPSGKVRHDSVASGLLEFLLENLPPEALLALRWASTLAATTLWMFLVAGVLWGTVAALRPEQAWTCLWRALLRLSRGQIPLARAGGSMPLEMSQRVIRDHHGGEGYVMLGTIGQQWGELSSDPDRWTPLVRFDDVLPSIHVMGGRASLMGKNRVLAMQPSAAFSSSLRPSIPRGAGARLPSTVYEMFLDSVRVYGYRDCIGHIVSKGTEEGGVHWLTYTEVLAAATCFGSGLIGIAEVGPGDRVGILGFNSREWMLADLACHCYSMTSVILQAPMSRSDRMRPLRHLERILSLADCSIIVCDRLWTKALLDAAGRGMCPNLRLVVQTSPLSYDEQIQVTGSQLRLVPFEFVIAAGRAYPQSHREPQPSATASVLFSFRPDMTIEQIEHTHASLAAMSLRLRAHPLGRSLTRFDVHVSYLPLVFTGERSLVYLLFGCGAAIGFVESAESGHLAVTAAKLHPTLLLLTPALLKSAFAYFGRIKRSWSAAYRMLFNAAFASKLRAVSDPAGPRIGVRDRGPAVARMDMWADVFIFNVLAELIGTSRLRFMLVVGSSATGSELDSTIVDFVQVTLCVPVLAAWSSQLSGITLVSPARSQIQGTAPSPMRTGFSGYLLPGVQTAVLPMKHQGELVESLFGGDQAADCFGELCFVHTPPSSPASPLSHLGRVVFIAPDPLRAERRGVPPTSDDATILETLRVKSGGAFSPRDMDDDDEEEEDSQSEVSSVLDGFTSSVGLIDTPQASRKAGQRAGAVFPVERSNMLVRLWEITHSPVGPPTEATVPPMSIVELLGDTSSVARVSLDSGEATVCCERLEAYLAFAGGVIRHLAILPLPLSVGGGLGAVVSVEPEECLLWATRTAAIDPDFDSIQLDLHAICRRVDFRQHVLSVLQARAKLAGFVACESIRVVYPTTAGLTSRNCLSTPEGLLRRQEVAAMFGDRLVDALSATYPGSESQD
jgi:hypothetical protein